MKYVGMLSLMAIISFDLKKLQSLGVSNLGFAVLAIGVFVALVGGDLVMHCKARKAYAQTTHFDLAFPARVVLSAVSVICPSINDLKSPAIGYFGIFFFYLGLAIAIFGGIYL